jgi:hypothetical protein
MSTIAASESTPATLAVPTLRPSLYRFTVSDEIAVGQRVRRLLELPEVCRLRHVELTVDDNKFNRPCRLDSGQEASRCMSDTSSL